MRPRVCMAIVSAKPAGTMIMNCRGEELKKHKRRAQFEINRRKLIASIGFSNAKLQAFSNGIQAEIARFRKEKLNKLN